MARDTPSIRPVTRAVSARRPPGRPIEGTNSRASNQAKTSTKKANSRASDQAKTSTKKAKAGNQRMNRPVPTAEEEPLEIGSSHGGRQVTKGATEPDLNARTLKAILEKLEDMSGQIEDLEQRQDIVMKNNALPVSVKRKNPTQAETAAASSKSKRMKPQPAQKKAISQSVADSESLTEPEGSEVDLEDGELSINESVSSDEESDNEPEYAPLEDMIDDAITSKTVRKILANKFVELSDLLPDLEKPSEEKYTMSVSERSRGAVFTRKRDRRNLRFDEWLQAFNIFAIIYQRRAKTVVEAQEMSRELMTYSRNITELRSKGYKWQAFDRAFRRRQVKQMRSWAHLPQGLMLQFQPALLSLGDIPYQGSDHQDFPRVPSGFCYRYHVKGKYCTFEKCKWKHSCPECQQEHPLYHCEANNAGKKQQKAT